jgi:hypothetical protein
MVALDGLIMLVPLLAFEIFVEALVLKGAWGLPYARLCKFTILANILSLLAGIPTEFLNSLIDAKLLPVDIPGYFARYLFVTAIDSTVYFAVTLLVEGAYAFRWLRRQKITISTASFCPRFGAGLFRLDLFFARGRILIPLDTKLCCGLFVGLWRVVRVFYPIWLGV